MGFGLEAPREKGGGSGTMMDVELEAGGEGGGACAAQSRE
jgi:hypothetical protein